MLDRDSVVHRVKALRLVRRMRGGSQASLLECDDGRAYVTKLRWNPQGPNVLANEWIATAMAKSVGLPVPECAMVDVDKSFIRQNPDLSFKLPQGSYMPPPGVHFGSRFVKPEGETFHLFEYLNSSQQSLVADTPSHVGMTLLEILTESVDRRGAVYLKRDHDNNISTFFIDFGHHFRGPSWKRLPTPASVFQYSLRTNPKMWANSRMINCWLEKFRKTLPRSLSHSISQVPRNWCTSDIRKMEARYLKRIADFDSVVDTFIEASSQSSICSTPLPGQEATL